MTILQNIIGAECAELAEMTHARHDRLHPLVVTAHRTNHRRNVWGKIIAVRNWLDCAREGEMALLLDADAVLMCGILEDEFPEPAELGVVLSRHEDLRWINSGVMFLRASDRLREFFGHVWQIGPQPGMPGCPEGGDQGAINVALKRHGLDLALMPNRYNAYTFAPCDTPVIAAFHGLPHTEKMRRMSQLLAA